jgi:hypothetical protein
MEGFIGGRRPTGKPRCRWKDAIWENSVYFLQIRNWRATVRKRAGWNKTIGEAMARKWAKVS